MTKATPLEELQEKRRADWPVGQRWVAYRLCDAYGFGKTKEFFNAVEAVCVEGRRSVNVDIPMEAIADNRAGHAYVQPFEFENADIGVQYLRQVTDEMFVPLQNEQPVYIEAWIEAAGMLGIVSRILLSYGIRVSSGGGSVALRTKYDLFRRVAQQAVPTRVLYLGDLDKYGKTIPSALNADVSMMLYHTESTTDYKMVRVAITDEQVEEWSLPIDPESKPGKAIVQAESLDDWQIEEAFLLWINRYHDPEIRQRNLEDSEQLRAGVHAAFIG